MTGVHISMQRLLTKTCSQCIKTSEMIYAHYAAESLSWYSRDRAKQLWMPLSSHNRLITLARSSGKTPCSSAVADRANSCWASSCSPTETRYNRRVPDERVCNYSLFLLCFFIFFLFLWIPDRWWVLTFPSGVHKSRGCGDLWPLKSGLIKWISSTPPAGCILIPKCWYQ